MWYRYCQTEPVAIKNPNGQTVIIIPQGQEPQYEELIQEITKKPVQESAAPIPNLNQGNLSQLLSNMMPQVNQGQAQPTHEAVPMSGGSSVMYNPVKQQIQDYIHGQMKNFQLPQGPTITPNTSQPAYNLPTRQSFNYKKYRLAFSEPPQTDFQTKVDKMRELNQYMPEELSQAKDEYLNKISQLNPVEHADELNGHWDMYTKELKKHPSFQNPDFVGYNDWRSAHNNDYVKAMCEDYKPGQLKKEFIDSGQSEYETWLKNKLEKKARELYNCESDLHKMQIEFGVTSQETNPFKAWNDVRKQWALQLADHFKDQIPFGEKREDRTVKFISGYPGAGKNTYIEPNKIDNNPVRNTAHGILIDSDEMRPFLPGWRQGHGSESTMAYAISVVKPQLIQSAIEKNADVVEPVVNGSAETICQNCVNRVVNDLRIVVVLIDVDAITSHKQAVNRATQSGRIEPPYTTGDPSAAWKIAKVLIENPNYQDFDIFTKKLMSKLGYTPAQARKLPLNELQAIHDRYAQLISFDVVK